jgi:predicted hydrocarbon binding protein
MSTRVITPSGFYYPNRIVRIYFYTLADIMGTNGLKSLLNMAGLERYIENYPPDNLDRQFDFADFTALSMALDDLYGPRGGRSLALRSGRAAFAQGLKNFGALAGAGDLAFKVLPLPAKLRIGIPALASIFNNFSDQISDVEERDDHFVYTMRQCPCCWNRKSDKAICHGGVGLLQETLRWVSGGREFRVVETECKATGHENCVLVAYKQPMDS